MLLGSLYVFVYWGLAESLMNEQAQTEQMTLSRHGHASWSPMLLMASASESNQPKPEAMPSKGSKGIETHRAPQGRSQSKGGRFQVPIKRDLEETAYNSSRAVVMCAYSRHTLCQAYTQVRESFVPQECSLALVLRAMMDPFANINTHSFHAD